MFRQGMLLLVLAAWGLANVQKAHGQNPQPYDPPTIGARTDADIRPIPYSVPPALFDRNGTTLWGHPDLDPPQAPPGWFVGLQVNIVGPAMMQHMFSQVTRGADTLDITLPHARFPWVGSPQLELGYRFPEAQGELTVSYRMLAAQGRDVLQAFDGAGAADLRSRLDVHITQLDYTTREFSLFPWCDMKAHVGVSLPSIFFDSHAFGGLRETHISSYYFGAGPHLGLDYWHRTPISGLELYARTAMNLTVGFVHQRFEDTVLLPDGTSVSGGNRFRKVREVPWGHLQAGLSYAPPRFAEQLRLVGGYTLERWWYLAQTDESRGELTVQGLFLRAEWHY